MPDKDILNLARLEEAFEDDTEGIADLLGMALNTGMQHLERLRTGIADGDIGTVSRAAHGIKGSASNVGAGVVAEISGEIEERARSGVWEGIAGLTDQLEGAYAQLRTSVAAYCAKVS